MVTVLFRCPQCQVYCISSLNQPMTSSPLANDIPTCRQCWNCAAESWVVQKAGALAIPQDGRPDLFFGHLPVGGGPPAAGVPVLRNTPGCRECS
jgi:hypothetical protein